MKFITSYYWQQGEDVPNSTSLLLHQLSRRKGEEDILLACVCEGSEAVDNSVIAGGYMTERLQVWFYEKALPQCSSGRAKRIPALKEGLRRTILQTVGELGGICPPVCGLFCMDSSLLLFYRGQPELYLLNNRFGNANLRRLSVRTEELVLQYGEIQKDAGVLLATHDFCTRVGEQALRECLAVREIHTKEQADKRLKELGDEAERRKAENAAAVLALAK